MSKKQEQVLRDKLVDAALKSLKEWHKENPMGVLPTSHPAGLKRGPKRDLLIAVIKLQKYLDSAK